MRREYSKNYRQNDQERIEAAGEYHAAEDMAQ